MHLMKSPPIISGHNQHCNFYGINSILSLYLVELMDVQGSNLQIIIYRFYFRSLNLNTHSSTAQNMDSFTLSKFIDSISFYFSVEIATSILKTIVYFECRFKITSFNPYILPMHTVHWVDSWNNIFYHCKYRPILRRSTHFDI